MRRRAKIYLDDDQLEALRRIAERRGLPVARLVREAVDAWLEAEGVRPLDEEESQRRFGALLQRRARIAAGSGFDTDRVERDVAAAVREVRRLGTPRRR